MNFKDFFDLRQSPALKVTLDLFTSVKRQLTRDLSLREELRHNEARLKHMDDRILELHQKGMEDPLTKVASRLAIEEALEKTHAQANRNGHYAIIILDLDHFKKFNDTYGHHGGDEALRVTGHVLKENVRKGDYVGRWGGEEFVIVLPGCTSITNAGHVAETLRVNIAAAEVKIRTSTEHITASVGVAFYAGLTSDRISVGSYLDVLSRADDALYAAKDHGKNRVFYHVSSNGALREFHAPAPRVNAPQRRPSLVA